MFGIDSAELLIIAVVALVVIGPKDLPRVMRTVGNFVSRARGMASQFRTGLDTMVRESELADLERQWKEQNERIMQEHPPAVTASDWGTPAAADGDPTAAPASGDQAVASAPAAPLVEPVGVVSPRMPRRPGPRPPAGSRRPPLPPRPGKLP